MVDIRTVSGAQRKERGVEEGKRKRGYKRRRRKGRRQRKEK